MSWTTAVSDVRILLSDSSTDKLRYRKEVFGTVDGSNATFKTFEVRRLTNFATTLTAPLGVYVNGVLQSAATSDDVESGEFTLSTAPAAGTSIRATYYTQWFDDPEIQQFLTTASEWISGADDWTQLDPSLWPAAKTYAAAASYQKLVSRYSANASEMYQLYDAPDEKRFDPIKVWGDESEKLYKLAFELRDDVYKNRKGQALAPVWGTVRGRTKDVPPNR